MFSAVQQESPPSHLEDQCDHQPTRPHPPLPAAVVRAVEALAPAVVPPTDQARAAVGVLVAVALAWEGSVRIGFLLGISEYLYNYLSCASPPREHWFALVQQVSPPPHLR